MKSGAPKILQIGGTRAEAGGPQLTNGQLEVVDHSHYPEDLIAKGRDIECLTLARAVGYHIERRVFLNANRTVVL